MLKSRRFETEIYYTEKPKSGGKFDDYGNPLWTEPKPYKLHFQSMGGRFNLEAYGGRVYKMKEATVITEQYPKGTFNEGGRFYIDALHIGDINGNGADYEIVFVGTPMLSYEVHIEKLGGEKNR
jgi:hypothetical protein